ncbi:hypothetical protein [Micromonospora sp. NPDC005413]|uniref:hypothetical protein n=1 Tax=Micromonospora sp. NPDC005413 TaxID=3154563 RepID=UPI0033B5C84B
MTGLRHTVRSSGWACTASSDGWPPSPTKAQSRRTTSERRARFLATIVNGLFTERALPTNALRLEFETDTLHMAANAVTTGSIGAERS